VLQNIVAIAERHGVLIVFLNVMISQGGLPLPVVPTLMTVAALARQNSYQVTQIILAGTSAALVAELTLYWCGLHYGKRFLGLLCRLSFSPDFCVRRTEEVFARAGPWSLLFAKVIPGLSLITVAMAGVTKMPVLNFLLLDAIGGVLFISGTVALGLPFQDAIISILSMLSDLGKIGGLIVLTAVGLYLLTKWWRRRLFIRQLRMDRITVAELRKLIDDGQKIVILDVRPKETRVREGTIPGAVSAHPADTDPALKTYPREMEIIVYCACPNEESAATAAKHLKQAGFKKIRPLLGGIDAWVQAGHPVERLN
jgi:membrane protein DedA with SNARE-associated domain/rhodanese-related sulfurtransferase